MNKGKVNVVVDEYKGNVYLLFVGMESYYGFDSIEELDDLIAKLTFYRQEWLKEGKK